MRPITNDEINYISGGDAAVVTIVPADAPTFYTTVMGAINGWLKSFAPPQEKKDPGSFGIRG